MPSNSKVLLASFVVLAVACGGSNNKPPENVGTTTTTGDKEPKVIIEDASEVWYDDTPASPKSKVREYDYDVTWSTSIKGSDAPPEIKKRRVRVVFPVPKREPTEEMTMVGFLDLDNKGEIKNSGTEKSDEAVKKAAIDECIMENVKGLAFAAAGDATKIRFKLKLQILDGATLQDFEDTPVAKDK